jgi:hypothetical protein
MSTTTFDLPDELWAGIFACFVNAAECSTLAALVLVCGRWKVRCVLRDCPYRACSYCTQDLAEPLLYRHISFNLRRVSPPLFGAAGDKVARWTRQIDGARVHGPVQERALLALVSAAPHLRSLRADARGSAAPLVIAALAAPGGPAATLVSLALSLHDGAAVAAALAHVGALHALAALEVRVFADAPLPVGAPGWRLPVLRRLTWRADTHSPRPMTSQLAFLSRCTLPALSEFALGGPALGAADSPHLAALFDGLPPLAHVDAWGFPARALPVLAPHVRARALTAQCDGMLAARGALPPGVVELRLETYPDSSALLGALDALGARARAGRAGPSTVVLSTRRALAAPFRWARAGDVGGAYAALVVRALGKAVLLEHRGIVLLDQVHTRAPVCYAAVVNVGNPRMLIALVDFAVARTRCRY